MAVMCELINWQDREKANCSLDFEEITSFSVSYDGGRFSLFINDKEVELSNSASGDWQVSGHLGDSTSADYNMIFS